MNILHLNVLKGFSSPAPRRREQAENETRETLAPFYFLGGVLLMTLVVLPLVWRVLEFVTLP